MAQRKSEEDTRTQREKFLDAARELGVSQSEAIFRRALEKKALRGKPKKAAQKSNKVVRPRA